MADASTSIKAALATQLDDEDLAWIERIEATRRELDASPERVVVLAYGAGRPDAAPRPFAPLADPPRSEHAVAQISQRASQPRATATILYRLVRHLRPLRCVEMGTCVGVSAAYQAAALHRNGHGHLVTIEGSPDLSRVAERALAALGLHRVELRVGPFQDLLVDVLSEEPADLVFVDGHHDEEATVRYFEQIVPLVTPGAVLVFDDISWSAGMQRAWLRIGAHPCTVESVDLGKIGVVRVLAPQARLVADEAQQELAELRQVVERLRGRRALRLADAGGRLVRRLVRDRLRRTATFDHLVTAPAWEPARGRVPMSVAPTRA